MKAGFSRRAAAALLLGATLWLSSCGGGMTLNLPQAKAQWAGRPFW